MKYKAVVDGIQFDDETYSSIMHELGKNPEATKQEIAIMAIHDSIDELELEIRYEGLPLESITPKFVEYFIHKANKGEKSAYALHEVKWEIIEISLDVE